MQSFKSCLFLGVVVAASQLGFAQTQFSPFPSRIVGQPSLQQISINQVALNLVEGREFFRPQAIAVDTSANPPILYVADTGNRAIRRIDLGPGTVSTLVPLRSPGSTLKPFTYVTAFSKGWSPATMVWDIPTTFPGGYKPNDFDNKFPGPMTVRDALAQSRNIPAVQALQFVGVQDHGAELPDPE